MTQELENNSKTMEYTFKAMGGEFHIRCFPQNFLNRDHIIGLFQKAEKEVQRVEAKLTDFKESPFNEINRLAGVRPVIVDDEIFNLIEKSIQISKDSDGAFDISYASVGRMWRIAKEKGEMISPSERNEARQYIDFKLIQLNKIERSVYLPHKKMKIGLGGIGKGYAVDRAYQILKEQGLYNFYVNGAGDIRVHSHNSAPRPWKIGIRNPLSSDSNKSMGVIQLKEGSVASSGGYIHKNTSDGGKLDHHILDPKFGVSAQELISSTVISDEAIVSDTTATILMNLSAKNAINFLNTKNMIGFVVDRSGKSHLSKRALGAFGYQKA